MERLKQMEIKKALFTIAFVNTAIAFLLSILSVWGCVWLRTRLAPEGNILYVKNDLVSITEISEPSAQEFAVLSNSLSMIQILLPILIYIAALFATASVFYRWKLEEPIEQLRKGAARIIDHDLDFTVESKSQDELGQLCAAFETMRKTLLENNYELWRQAEERKRLNAAFSHDLRNPVTVVKGSAKLARSSIENSTAGLNLEQLSGHLLRIESYTGRIEHYVETMSSIQKLEEIPVERERIKWDDLAIELENMIQLVGADCRKQIRFRADAYPGSIYVDKSILFQITENLVTNAMRFARQSIDIFCSISKSDGKLILKVTDDGCGFPEKLVQNGIQPFQKGNEEAGHLGIGLYICELLCGKHGGSIEIRNHQAGASITAVLAVC